MPSNVDLSKWGYLDSISLPDLVKIVGKLIGSEHLNILQQRAFEQSGERGYLPIKRCSDEISWVQRLRNLMNTKEMSFL